MTTNSDDTRKTANYGEYVTFKNAQTNNDDKVYIGKLEKPLHFDIIFQFKDGEKAVFKNAKSMQEFLDKMNAFHELEKENQQLKELLKVARDILEKETYDLVVKDIDEVLK